jgi:hypothetical protein
MTLKRPFLRLLALAALAAVPTAARAQYAYDRGVQSFAPADTGHTFQPFGPVEAEMDYQPFGILKTDDQSYDGKEAWTQGWFGSYERLNWSTSRAERHTLGDNSRMFVASADGFGLVEQLSSFDQSVRHAPLAWGNRYQLGYWDGPTGWMAGILDFDHQVQETVDTQVAINFVNPDITQLYIDAGFIPALNPNNIHVTMLSGFVDIDNDGIDDDRNNDGRGGRFVDTDADGVPDTLASAGNEVDFGDLVILPTRFDHVLTRNSVETSGVELMKMYRLRPLHNESIVEFAVGARYMEVNEDFTVNAQGGFGNAFTTLGSAPNNNNVIAPLRVQSFWDNRIDNNIVGPQLAARWYSRRGAWNFIVEGRFLAGFNFQNVEQRGQLAGNIPSGIVNAGNPAAPNFVPLVNAPLAFNNVNFNHYERFEEFTPIGELRVETAYQITKSIALKGGFTGMYQNGIGRASSMIVYQLPTLGISQDNREDVWTAGFNFGVEVNR